MEDPQATNKAVTSIQKQFRAKKSREKFREKIDVLCSQQYIDSVLGRYNIIPGAKNKAKTRVKPTRHELKVIFDSLDSNGNGTLACFAF